MFDDEAMYIPDSAKLTRRSERPLVWVEKRLRVSDGYSNSTSINPTNYMEKKLLVTWRNMIRRCYIKTDSSYPNYGGKGIFVSKEWRNADQFVQDARLLPNWLNKSTNWDLYDLDKDYFGSNCYSAETCVWLHRSENSIYRENSPPIAIKFPDGRVKYFINLSSAAKFLEIGEAQLNRMIKGEVTKKTSQGWDACYCDPQNYVLRHSLSTEIMMPSLTRNKKDL